MSIEIVECKMMKCDSCGWTFTPLVAAGIPDDAELRVESQLRRESRYCGGKDYCAACCRKHRMAI